MNDVERFARLFRGRTDAWGTDTGSCRHEEVTLGNYDRHLDGAVPFGVYPLLDDNTAWWGCTDIDQGYENIAPAVNIWKVFKALGIPAYVEKTRSKGYHVWVFFTGPVSAQVIRNAFLFVHQVADVPPKEINPKAPTLEGLVLGNYVRVPYPRRGALGTQVMLDMERADRCPLSLHEFLETVVCAETSRIEAVAARYVPPPAPTHVAIGEYHGELEPLIARMSGLTYTIYMAGPLPGMDRSSTMVRLCYLMHTDGLSATEAFVLLEEFDRVWGKFIGRPDRDHQLGKMIERAYG